MGFMKGIAKTGGQPAAGVTLEFRRSGVNQGHTDTGTDGSYTSPNLAGGVYTVFKIVPNPEAQCDCAGVKTFNVPTAGVITKNLNY